MHHPLKTLRCFVVVCLVLVCCVSARADFIVDDFSTPSPVEVPVIGLLNPDPTLVETPDAAIAGGERDILLDVIGTPQPGSLIAVIGAGRFLFNSSSPGTAAIIQYDGLDADIVGPPGALVNSEGLGGLNLTIYGSEFSLDFLGTNGGHHPLTDVEIEVHSSTGTALFAGVIPDGPGSFVTPFSAFSDASVFTDVTSMEFRLNPHGAPDVDFLLDSIRIVPEPSTVAMTVALLISWLLVCFRRRNRAA